MNTEIFSGLLLILSGIFVFVRGLKNDDSKLVGLKFRQLLIGGGAILFGLIIMFR